MIDTAKAYTPPAAHKATGWPLEMVYAAIRSGELKAVRRGTRFLISGGSLLAWIESLGEVVATNQST